MKIFKKKNKFPTENVARSMDEINQDYARALGEAGQKQYVITVVQRELEELNKKLLSLNLEAAERNKLDAAAKPQETTNV